MSRRVAAIAAGVLLALAAAHAAQAATRYQPRLRFRVLSTAHFRVYYHQGEERLAARLASIAESVRASLPDRLRLRAPAMTHVVLADQDDEPSGTATPLPYNTITLSAARPPLSDINGNTNDWLRLVFTHEYAHVLQLDQSFGWAAAFRAVLGRSPIVFPNLFLPRWQIEGLATYAESVTTGQGRLYAGESIAIVKDRAVVAGVEPIDRANGGLTDWPGGLAPYLDGAFFYDYLVARFGEAKVGEVSTSAAGRLPYLASPAFKKSLGQGLGSLWAGYQRDLARGAGNRTASASSPRQLTHLGYQITGPRFAGDGRSIVFSVQDADRFPSIMVLPPDGQGAIRRLADRFRGTRVGVHGDAVYFDEVELADDVALRSDLHEASLASGAKRTLTSGARLAEPDVSPDGRTIACVRMENGRRALAFFRIERGSGETARLEEMASRIPADAEASYGSPRWSPGGRLLAVERRRAGGPAEIVVLDTDTGAEQVIASSATSRNITPAWLPDGRTILFASDRSSGSFQLYAARLEDNGPPLQVTSVLGGATDPDVATDGARIVFVGSGAGGNDLFEIPVDAGAWRPAEAPATLPAPAGPPSPGSAPAAGTSDSAYSPIPTLLPRSWTPQLDMSGDVVRAGVAVDGVDVLGRHAFGTSLLWRVSGPGAPVVDGHAGRPDWTVQYAYSRWRPSLVLSASDQTSLIPASGAASALQYGELRELEATAGLSLALRKVRHTQVLYGAFSLERDTFGPSAGDTVSERNGVRAAWAFNSAKIYGRSISPEDGLTAAVTAEPVRKALGADGDADAFTGEIRAYLRVGPGHSVLAARAGFGTATGDLSVRRRFYLGGSSPAGPLVDFGTSELSMLRGFQDKIFSGSSTAVLNAEWRQPLWRVERGWGVVPVFVRCLHAAAFADLGNAWDGRFDASATKVALGGEGSVDLVLGFALPLTFSAGVAWTRDGAPGGASGTVAYFRIGRAF